MLFLHWEYATTYAFHSLLLYENQSYLSSYLSSKIEAWAMKKKRGNKEQKALVSKEKRREKNKVAMPSQKEAREGKLLKGVLYPPNIPHTCTS